MKSISIDIEPFIDIDDGENGPQVVYGAFIGEDSEGKEFGKETLSDLLDRMISDGTIPNGTARPEHKQALIESMERMIHILEEKIKYVGEIPEWNQ